MTETAIQQHAIVHVFPTPIALGEAAAQDIATELRHLLASQATVRMIFAAAPSQSAMLHALAKADGVEWQRVEAFHMDEYIGLAPAAPQRFGNWLQREFFEHVPLGKVHLIEPGDDADNAANTYTALMAEAPIDIVCLGIGMNGHIAFNDPPANFHEAQDVRVVALDLASRVQQVSEGLFPRIEDVPQYALSLSIPRLLRANKLFCCVSGSMKNAAVVRAFTQDISPLSPASILREHEGCTVYLDEAAASGLTFGDR